MPRHRSSRPSRALKQLPPSVALWWIVVLSGFLVSVLAGHVPVTVTTFAIILVCAIAELIDSSLGMGYGTTLTPLLIFAGFEPLLLVPTILVSELVSGFGAAFFHAEAGNLVLRRGSPHLRVAVVLSVCSLVGVYAGVELAFAVPKRVLLVIISSIILAAGIYTIVRSVREPSYRPWKIMLLGVVASFNKALSGGGYGPLMTSGQILSGIAGRSAVGITSLAEGFTCLAAASLFLIKGTILEPSLLIPVMTGTLLSVPASAQLVKRLPEVAMKRIIGFVTIGLGLFSFFKVLSP